MKTAGSLAIYAARYKRTYRGMTMARTSTTRSTEMGEPHANTFYHPNDDSGRHLYQHNVRSAEWCAGRERSGQPILSRNRPYSLGPVPGLLAGERRARYLWQPDQ